MYILTCSLTSIPLCPPSPPSLSPLKHTLTHTPHCIGGVQLGVNPKINNMLPGYRNAQFNLIWICDSGIKGKSKISITNDNMVLLRPDPYSQSLRPQRAHLPHEFRPQDCPCTSGDFFQCTRAYTRV